MVDAQGPDLEVGEDAMDPGQDDMGGHLANDMGIMDEACGAGIAGPSSARGVVSGAGFRHVPNIIFRIFDNAF